MTPLQTLAFFRSAIISGEPWTDAFQQAYTQARGVLALQAAPAVPREVTCPHCGLPFEVEA